MSLTHEDLQQIRSIVESIVQPLGGELEALRNDIKETYGKLSDLVHGSLMVNESFQKLSIEDKLLMLNSELLAAARQAGITLPR